jgi:5-methylcytosine-specific restriction endonuclease McrA
LNALCRCSDEIDRELLVQAVQARTYGLLLIKTWAQRDSREKPSQLRHNVFCWRSANIYGNCGKCSNINN